MRCWNLVAGLSVDAQIINGSSLAYNRDHGADAQGVNARAVLPSGRYDLLILTEAGPMAGNIQWSDTYGMTENHAELAWNANPDTRVLIYETWDELTNPTAWRAVLTSDFALWQGIVDNLNAILPGTAPPVGLVPGGQAAAGLYDTIAQGRGQGLTNIRQIFSESIRLK